jgi:glycine cleavage system H protein
MPIFVRGCPLEPDRLYDVEQHLWYMALQGGLVRLGMTSVATALAGEVLAFTPKRVGRRFDVGRSCATIESGKWVGPARAAFGGTVVEVNDALIQRPSLANRDPYGAGWMLVAQPDDPAAALAGLITGSALAPAYEAWMTREGFAGCQTP